MQDENKGKGISHVIEHIEDAVARRNVEALAAQIPAMVTEAVEHALSNRALTPEQAEWVRLAVESAGKKAKFRDAVIEKTLSGLLILFIAAVGAGMIAIGKGWLISLGLLKP